MATKTVTWQGRTVQAAAPEHLARWMPSPTSGTVRATAEAAGAVQRLGDRTIGPIEAAARLLLRAEGLASSAIEGLRATAADVALAEAGGTDDESTAAWVADNLAVVTESLRTPGPLTVDALLAWHSRLMRNAPTIAARHVGAFRDTLGWVGGASPLLAVHVAAPAEDVPALMEDLVTFVARNDVDPITKTAVVHAQFETIHPFADGNGRIGRVLIGWMIATDLGVNIPPPVSLQMAQDVGGYQSGLTLYRQGLVDVWVSWFADAVAKAAAGSAEILSAVSELQSTWREATSGVRADSVAHRIVELLPEHPILSSSLASESLNVSAEAARVALVTLEGRGVVSEIDGPRRRGRPQRWWEAKALLDLLGRTGQ